MARMTSAGGQARQPGRMRLAAPLIVFALGACAWVSAQPTPSARARWISAPGVEPCPVNRFTYLRREVNLARLTGDLTLRLAADSNAHVWINGVVVRRKVTRYAERSIRTETIDVRRLLHTGINTVVVLNHSWGPITTFQRTGCQHAGIYVASEWLNSDGAWKTHTADEFDLNDRQITGVTGRSGAIGDHRIRFAEFVHGERLPAAAMFAGGFDDAGWTPAEVVSDGPWPASPAANETPGQRERLALPRLMLARGKALESHVEDDDPVAIENAMFHADYQPDGRQAVSLPFAGKTAELVVRGQASETRYVTFDFGRPVHGYPLLQGNASVSAPTIDFAYGELNYSPLTGTFLVDAKGWINPEAIVGKGYIDRYYATPGAQYVEMPDERTARWWTIHLYFPKAGVFRIRRAAFVTSQYPIDLRGSFHCGDARVDQIVRLSLEHATVSMSDTYVDTPGREDGQWLEDARLRAQLAAQWFGDVRLRQLLLRLAAESQMADGPLHPFPPSNYPIVSTADWSAEWVGALYDDYLWTGETTRLQAYWPQVVTWWDGVIRNVGGDGLWRDSKVFADIRVGVHAQKGQSSGIASAQIIQRLTLSIQMAEAVGDREHVAAWTAIHATMLAAFRREHLVPARGPVPTHVDDVAAPEAPDAARGFSEAAQAMAIEGGLLTQAEASADLDYSFAAPDGAPSGKVDRWNNPTYLYRSLNALTMTGRAERAVQHLLERFAPYLPGDPRNPSPRILQGPWGGPLPEYWVSREDLKLAPGELNPAQPRDPTGSHGWNAVGLVWLHDSLLGVKVLKPGGSVLQIKPDAGGLPFVEGTTMTPRGEGNVSWKPAANTLAIRLPPWVSALITLPPKLASLQEAGRLNVPASCSADAGDTLSCSGRALIFAARKASPTVTYPQNKSAHRR